MQEVPIILSRLSKLIEYKINNRNKQALCLPKNEKLVSMLDSEIDVLEGVEIYICQRILESGKFLSAEKHKSFNRGIQSGLMQAKTGRHHPEHFFE
jgi:hypothetical protein